jgi:phosphoribosyl 1,2-cyclic phosphodiesterase
MNASLLQDCERQLEACLDNLRETNGYSCWIIFVVSSMICRDAKSRALDDMIVSHSFSDAAKGVSVKSPLSPSNKYISRKSAASASSESPVQRLSPLKLAPLPANRLPFAKDQFP